MSNGKGSKFRPTNFKAFNSNFDQIKGLGEKYKKQKPNNKKREK